MSSRDGDEPRRLANGHVSGAPFNVYEATDGYVSICAASAPDWRKLVTALGKPELARDPRYSNTLKRRDRRGEVDAIVQEWVGQRTVNEAVEYLQEQCALVRSSAHGS